MTAILREKKDLTTSTIAMTISMNKRRVKSAEKGRYWTQIWPPSLLGQKREAQEWSCPKWGKERSQSVMRTRLPHKKRKGLRGRSFCLFFFASLHLLLKNVLLFGILVPLVFLPNFSLVNQRRSQEKAEDNIAIYSSLSMTDILHLFCTSTFKLRKRRRRTEVTENNRHSAPIDFARWWSKEASFSDWCL